MAAMPKRKDWRSDTASSRSLPNSAAFAFLGQTHHRFLYFLKKWPENGPRKVPLQGSVAEGSKALDLGSSLFGGVGSNPTAASSDFKEGQTP